VSGIYHENKDVVSTANVVNESRLLVLISTKLNTNAEHATNASVLC